MGLKNSFFVTFEGIEGCGKSTQINKVYNFFKKKKIKCIKTREPGGTFIAEKIRKLILKKSHKVFLNTQINSFNRGYHTVLKYKKMNTLPSPKVGPPEVGPPRK